MTSGVRSEKNHQSGRYIRNESVAEGGPTYQLVVDKEGNWTHVLHITNLEQMARAFPYLKQHLRQSLDRWGQFTTMSSTPNIKREMVLSVLVPPTNLQKHMAATIQEMRQQYPNMVNIDKDECPTTMVVLPTDFLSNDQDRGNWSQANMTESIFVLGPVQAEITNKNALADNVNVGYESAVVIDGQVLWDWLVRNNTGEFSIDPDHPTIPAAQVKKAILRAIQSGLTPARLSNKPGWMSATPTN